MDSIFRADKREVGGGGGGGEGRGRVEGATRSGERGGREEGGGKE